MLRRGLLLVVICVGAEWAAEAAHLQRRTRSRCPLGFIGYRSSCYLFSHNTVTYGEAMSFCSHYESRLAEINSRYEEEFMRRYLKEGTSYYIGGTDLRLEGIWTWEEPVRRITYLNWYPGEPNNSLGKEHCLDLFKPRGYRMNDSSCNTKNRFVCEKKKVYPK